MDLDPPKPVPPYDPQQARKVPILIHSEIFINYLFFTELSFLAPFLYSGLFLATYS